MAATASARARSAAGVGRSPSGPVIARSSPTSAAGKASGSRRARIATYWAVQSPTPGSAVRRAMAASRDPSRRNRSGSVAAAAAIPEIAVARARGMPSWVRSAAATRSGGGKTADSPSSSPPAPARNGSPCSFDKPTDQPARAAHGDLLAEHRPNGQLEAVPCPWHPQAGPGRDQRPEQRIPSEVSRDRSNIRVEIEQPADARHDRRPAPRHPETGSSPREHRVHRDGLTSIVPCRPARSIVRR